LEDFKKCLESEIIINAEVSKCIDVYSQRNHTEMEVGREEKQCSALSMVDSTPVYVDRIAIHQDAFKRLNILNNSADFKMPILSSRANTIMSDHPKRLIPFNTSKLIESERLSSLERFNRNE
jgi:hypothetical protein